MTRKVLVIGDLLIFLRFFIFFFQDISKHLKDFPALVAFTAFTKKCPDQIRSGKKRNPPTGYKLSRKYHGYLKDD